MGIRSSAAAATLSVLLAGCVAGGTPAPQSPTSRVPTAVGNGEGTLEVLTWPGYVENGTTDPALDWMSEWEAATGCETTVQVFETPEEGFRLFTAEPARFDVVSATGDAGNRLAQAGHVQPVNTALIPSFADVFEDLKNKPWNTFNGESYGLPQGRGANVLMWRTDAVAPQPTSWASIFDPVSPHAGKFAVYDAPIAIADAAVYLMATEPDLKISNPYALDESQFTAAVDLLTLQKPAVGAYWSDPDKQATSFTSGDTVVGTSRQEIVNVLEGAGVPVAAVKPDEGATGWSHTWMINARTKRPNCAYRFLDHVGSPEVNVQIAEHVGEAPANSKACALATNPDHCAIFHAQDDDYWNDVWLWTTPTEACVDGRTDVKCRDFAAWAEAWGRIRAS